MAPFLNLRRAAQADGIDLEPLSSFRDFARQLTIWNGKFSGERPMLDAAGMRLDAAVARAAGNASTPFCCGRRCPAPAGITGARTWIWWIAAKRSGC